MAASDDGDAAHRNAGRRRRSVPLLGEQPPGSGSISPEEVVPLSGNKPPPKGSLVDEAPTLSGEQPPPAGVVGTGDITLPPLGGGRQPAHESIDGDVRVQFTVAGKMEARTAADEAVSRAAREAQLLDSVAAVGRTTTTSIRLESIRVVRQIAIDFHERADASKADQLGAVAIISQLDLLEAFVREEATERDWRDALDVLRVFHRQLEARAAENPIVYALLAGMIGRLLG